MSSGASVTRENMSHILLEYRGLLKTIVIRIVVTRLNESVLLIDASLHISVYKAFAVWTCTAQCVDACINITLINRQTHNRNMLTLKNSIIKNI